jgi:hypothetical protein
MLRLNSNNFLNKNSLVMKKITVLSLILVLLSFAASAQLRSGGRLNLNKERRENRRITPFERKELRKDAVRYHMMKRKASRDGVIGPIERRKLRHARCEGRRDAFRFKHNGRRRVI